MTRIALNHHGRGLEHRVCDLSNGQLFVVGLLSRDDRRIGCQHEVDTGVWDQVSLELRDIDVQRTIESEGSCQGGNDLSNQTIQVGICWALDVQIASADVVQGLVINLVRNISVLQ